MRQLIDMSVPSDSNISAKEFEKLCKYKDLEIEIAKMWKMKTNKYCIFYIQYLRTRFITIILIKTI